MTVRRYFTPDEANRMLPLIRVIVRDILEKGDSLRSLGSEGRGVSPRFKKALKEIAGLTEELESLGCTYKDAGYKLGMVDFPAFINGQEILLCWQSDEDAVCHYHREDEGFAARRRIPPNWVHDGSASHAPERLESMEIQWAVSSAHSDPVIDEALLVDLAALKLADAREIYRIRHRSVYQTALPSIGDVAVKEVRHLRWKQRWKWRAGVQSKAEREFANAEILHAKGVRTPRPWALGLERDWLGLRRVLQIYAWLPDASTLTECVKREEVVWPEVASALWSAAQAGLVHGGHSSENLMHSQGRWQVIDLADARIETAYNREGFVRDAARIARKLIREQAAGDAQIQDFIAAVAEVAADPAMREDIPIGMERLLQEARDSS